MLWCLQMCWKLLYNETKTVLMNSEVLMLGEMEIKTDLGEEEVFAEEFLSVTRLEINYNMT